MAGVTPAMVHATPPGIANPLGATYAHLVCSEDMLVQGMLKQSAPLSASAFAGNTGLSEPMPNPGPEWSGYADWTRRVRIDLAALQAYARSVYTATDEYLAGLQDADLERPMDLSFIGLGQQTLGITLSVLVLHHIGTETGELACLKGIQGVKGYPF
jgi:DinB superfamily